MNNKNIILIIAGLLIAIGLIKPPFITNFLNRDASPQVVNIEDVKVNKPTNEDLILKSKEVIEALSVSNDRKVDGKKLAKLYLDIATLISLDGENEVIKNTEEIRQANRLSGLMLQLDIKDKYDNLAEANQALIVHAIGDDSVPLTKDLRAKAVEGFQALAWACYEGSK